MNVEKCFKLLLPFQKTWLEDRGAMSLGEKSRRIGWTWVHGLGVTLDRIDPNGDGSNYYHSSTDQSASVEFIDYCAEWAHMANAVAKVKEEKELIDEQEINALVMKFDNGTKIVAGTSNPKFFRSKGGDAGLDEFAFHAQGRELVKAAHATALFWGHRMRIWSTHKGESSYFNTMIKSARKGELKARVHRVTILDAVQQGIVERIIMRKKKLSNPPEPDETARKDWLAELRATCPDEDTWNEEYMVMPSSEANALLTYELIAGCERSAEELKVVEDPNELKFNGGFTVGWDVARKKDKSLIWALRKIGDVFETPLIKSFQNTRYGTQEDYFNLLMSKGATRACIDSTGLGGQLAERAIERWGAHRVEAVNFSAPVKSELAIPLKRLFEDKLVRIPAEASIREGLHKVRKITTAAGNVRFDAKHDEEGHADEFWALALAYHAADDSRRPVMAPSEEKPEWLL
jgi:phage FluMu gp28-like protein